MMASGTAMGGSSQAKPYEYQNGGMQETKGGGLFAAAGSPAFAPPRLRRRLCTLKCGLLWIHCHGFIPGVFRQRLLRCLNKTTSPDPTSFLSMLTVFHYLVFTKALLCLNFFRRFVFSSCLVG
ncbi:hypothetical protein BC829DRAFT_269138 [Chytridium lagenaria]|nr:hypothetical protein BC829DRAFT_269138 [Chytridium lagenaria]